MSMKISNWIPIEEACCLLNLKEKTIKDRCYDGSFVYKIIKKNNKNKYYIH